MNLSPRWKKIISTTPESLGPNHYDPPTTTVLPNRVPFLSTRERNSNLATPVYCDAWYDCNKRSIVGGRFLSRSKRTTIRSKWGDGPGPGTYNPKLIERKSHRASSAPVVKGKKLYVCRVPYKLSASGPSIPSRGDLNGYDYDEKGELIKIPPDDYDQTLGPAFYCINHAPCLTTCMYKGCRWSKSKTQRPDLAKGEGPGPAAYDARYKKTENWRDDDFREMARMFSFQPRYLDIVQRDIMRKDYPGPGAYNLSTPSRPKSLSLIPHGFGSNTERPSLNHGLELSDPTKYDVSKSLLMRSVSIKDAPFNVDSQRFARKRKADVPGPAEYDQTSGAIETNLQKELTCITESTPPFNHSSERNTVHVARDVLVTPGPNQYLVENLDKEKMPRDGSVFRSVTCRFQDFRDWKCAEPATYSVSEPFNRNRNRKSYNVGTVPFQSAGPSRPVPRPSSFYSPDPCKYNAHVEVNPKGSQFNRRSRFVEENETPGPGNYTIHPSFTTSTYKAVGTFNLRLKEQVLHSKLRLAPSMTRQAWLNEIKKRKQLVVFYRPPKKIASWLELD